MPVSEASLQPCYIHCKTLPLRNDKISLTFISMLYRQMIKHSLEQNRSSSLEVKCRIARIEVGYSSSKLISRQAVEK